jgi:hypothetical protein
MRESWRRGETTRAFDTPAVATRKVDIRIQAIPTLGAARLPLVAASRRANPRGMK